MFLYFMISNIFTIILVSSVMGYEGRDIEVYTTLVSGHFSTVKSLSELRKEGAGQSIIDIYMVPINYPALNSEIVIFFCELKDGSVRIQKYMAFNQLGPVIHFDIYYVNRPDLFNPASLNISKLESLSRDDLHVEALCKSSITRIGETRFNAEFEGICNIDGDSFVTYKVSHSCDNQTFPVESNEFPESKSKPPYMLYKLENYPVPASIFPDYDNYKAMCGY